MDAALAVHLYFKSHSGGILTMGHGAVLSYSRKQEQNTRSSTEAEFVAVDDIAGLYMSKPINGKKFSEQCNAILNLVPAAAAQLIMISHFQCGPTKKRGNILKHSDAYIWEMHYQSRLYYKKFDNKRLH